MMLSKGMLNRKREKALLWYDYYFLYPNGNGRILHLLRSYTWYHDVCSCRPVKKVSIDMTLDDSEPKDIENALVCFVMNDNEFPSNLRKRVERQLYGEVEAGERKKGSNQWGIDLCRELKWLDDEGRQLDFVLLKDYVRPVGTRGPRPTAGKIRSLNDGRGDENAALGLRPEFRGKAQGVPPSTPGLLESVHVYDDHEHDGSSEPPSEDYDDGTYDPCSTASTTRRRTTRSATVPPQRSSPLAHPSALAAATANEPSVTRSIEAEQQQPPRQSHRHMTRLQELQRQSPAGSATASPGPHGGEHPTHEDEEATAAAQDMSPADAGAVQWRRAAKRTRSQRAGSRSRSRSRSQGLDGPVDKKRSRFSSAPAQRAVGEDSLAGEPSGRSQTPLQPSSQRSRVPGHLPPVRRPAVPVPPETPGRQQSGRRLSSHGGQLDGPDSDDASRRRLADWFSDHMPRCRSANAGQPGTTGAQQDLEHPTSKSGTTDGADTGELEHAAAATGDKVTRGGGRGGQDGEGDEARKMLEEVVGRMLAAHARGLEVRIQMSLDAMEENLRAAAAAALPGSRVAQPPPRPGSKLPDGSVVWDVRLLTAGWDPDPEEEEEEESGGFFASAVEGARWYEDGGAWARQERYLASLALAHRCGPGRLAALVRAWRLEDLDADPARDPPVVLARKVYVRAVAEAFREGQMEVFLNSIADGQVACGMPSAVIL
ncbi:hypothetical protein VSDG_05146 [Cytospora chrysosperma]|uniref:Uncharacterized protein n=1 Tax=Cytospora chrysosperma TaxID=252740 RepID=A0A423VXU7_CYTCH|nr:hypothetical protein VSDG_05146 [Valsa sordida]